jgi:hypothetical protein
MNQPPRSGQQRRRDTLRRLEDDVDAWIATASVDGSPYLVPLSFFWDGASLLISTPASSPTSRNLQATRKVRVGVGPTRDLVLIEGTVEVVDGDNLSDEIGNAFAEKTGFDPRDLATHYSYFRIYPQRIQAWREANELDGRELMRGGTWLVTD